MKVYIAGKITGLPDLNRPRFERAKTLLTELGHEVVSPLDLEHKSYIDFPYMELPPTWTCYMRTCIKHLVECDAIALLNDWYDSRGARMEFDLSVNLGISCLVLDKHEQSIIRTIKH